MARRLLRLGRSKSVVRRCTAAPPRSSILPIGATAREAVEARDKDFVGKSPCDFAYHIMLHSEPPPEFSSQLDEAIQAGYPTLKIFTTNILPSRSPRDHGSSWRMPEGDLALRGAEPEKSASACRQASVE
jgi:hypothetical protein